MEQSSLILVDMILVVNRFWAQGKGQGHSNLELKNLVQSIIGGITDLWSSKLADIVVSSQHIMTCIDLGVKGQGYGEKYTSGHWRWGQTFLALLNHESLCIQQVSVLYAKYFLRLPASSLLVMCDREILVWVLLFTLNNKNDMLSYRR